jgi:hypothetical protein
MDGSLFRVVFRQQFLKGFKSDTLDQLAAVGFDSSLLERPQGWWEQ